MAVVTGYNAGHIDTLIDASITEAEYNSGTGKLKLTTRGGDVVLDEVVKGATGAAGPTGPPGDVSTAELNAAIDAVKDICGLGLVAMDEYSATDIVKSGGDDSFHTVDNIALTYTFVAGRSYRIDFGIHVEFGALSTDDNVVSLDLREGSNTVRRFTIPGDTESHTAGVGGTHVIKECVWSGSKTLTMRFQKRTGANVTIANTSVPSFVSITDLGNNFG